MIIDSSAIIAIIDQEPGYERLLRRLAEAAQTRIGAPTYAEAGLVLVARYGARGRTLLARFLQENHIKTEPFTEQHAEIAIDAYSRYGKGRHPAGLNFGDCLTYATAYVAREPLLCVGNDFTRTELELAP
jgi:ribonuclease VapC